MELSQEDVQVASKSCTPFTNCISDIHNTRVDEAKRDRNCDVVVFEFQMVKLGSC